MTDISTSSVQFGTQSLDPISIEAACGEVASRAAEASISLWDSNFKTFWRSTEHRAREQKNTRGGAFFATVTLTSSEALARLACESPVEWHKKSDANRIVVDELVPTLLSRGVDDIKSSLDESPARRNPFTRSRLIQAYAACMAVAEANGSDADSLHDKVKDATTKLLDDHESLVRLKDAEIHHPFILFHALRAFRLADNILDQDRQICETLKERKLQLYEELREATVHLLGYRELGLLSPPEAVALGFCAASLAHSSSQDDQAYVLPAMKACFEGQDVAGCWPLGRVISENKDKAGAAARLEISTYEIAWALSEALSALCQGQYRGVRQVPLLPLVEKLGRALEYAQKSIVHISGAEAPFQGWCTDHPYGKPMIESWTSATVLQFALSFYELSQVVQRNTVLTEFATTMADPRDENWPSWLRWERFRENNEPQTEPQILAHIDDRLVKPILANPRHLPSAEDKTVSVLLFGPPGTAKTSIVKAVADGLGWPLVMLSPGDFIAKGLEQIEAQSAIVFSRLRTLSRAVVLFDECDELFRSRDPSPGTEQTRGISAFVTATMLPKLQDLHDRGRVVFFINTNHLESMDNAVKRGGRVDHIVAVGPPEDEARLQIIRDAYGKITTIDPKEMATIPDTALEALTSATSRFTRSELQRAMKDLHTRLSKDPAADPIRSARQVAKAMEDSLAITPKEYEDFKRLRDQYSHPHLETKRR